MPALKAIFSADATPFSNEMKRMVAMADSAGKNIQNTLNNPKASRHAQYAQEFSGLMAAKDRAIAVTNQNAIDASVEAASRSNRARALRRKRAEDQAEAARALNASIAGGSMPESWQGAAASRQAQLAARSRFNAGQMQLIHSLRASFDSLATGASPFTVMLQQIPQVMQGISMMEGGFRGFIKTLLSMKVGPLATLGGIIAGIGAGAFVAYKHSKALIDKLSGFKLPDFSPEYIPKHLQRVNAIAEAWREIGKEVRKVTEEYASAGKMAERAAVQSKSNFDHQRKMLEIQKETAMAGARTPTQKAAVEKEFARTEAALNAKERNADLAAKYVEQANLGQESINASQAAAKIQVSSREHDQNEINKNKLNLEAADAAAKQIELSKREGTFGVNGRDIFRAYNSVTDSGVSTTDLDAAEKKVIADRAQYKKAYQDSVDRGHTNDVTRERRDELNKRAAESVAKGLIVGKEIAQKKKENATAAERDAEEIKAKDKLADEQRRHANRQQSGYTGELTANQKIGAHIGGPQITLLEINRQILQAHHETNKILKAGGGGGGRLAGMRTH